MAWIENWQPIPNKPGWQYDAAVSFRTDPQTGEYITYKDSPGTISNGIRTYVNESGETCEVYVRCRQIDHPERILGEVSKTYYDYKNWYDHLYSYTHNHITPDQYTDH